MFKKECLENLQQSVVQQTFSSSNLEKIPLTQCSDCAVQDKTADKE